MIYARPLKGVARGSATPKSVRQSSADATTASSGGESSMNRTKAELRSTSSALRRGANARRR